jgi:hypothetical protein
MSSSVTAVPARPNYVHRLRPELLEKCRIELIRNYGFLFLFLLAFLLLPILSVAIDMPEAMIVSIIVTGFICAAGALGIIFIIRRELRKMERLYLSYELAIDEIGIRRDQADTPPFVSEWREVTRAEVTTGKGIRLLTGKFATFLWIPDELERYEEVLAVVQLRCPVENKAGLPFYLRQNVTGFLYILLLFAALSLENRMAATLVSVLTLATISFAVVHTLKNPNATTKLKRGMIWYLLPVGMMLYRLWTLWLR